MIRFEHPTLSEQRMRPAHPARRSGGRIAHGAARRPDSEALPLVTIVVAVRNGERFLEESLRSAIEQTYPNVEIVVADGASTDGTLAILEAQGERIDHWVSEPDGGAFDGMNRGIALAAGRYVKIHGHDDVLPRDSAATAVEAFARLGERASTAVVRSDMEIIDGRGAVLQRAGLSPSRTWSPPILHPTWYVPMRLYERFGLYDPTSAASSDYEKYFQLERAGVSFVHVDRPLASFRRGGLSTAKFSGLRDSFDINRRYLGLPVASYGLAVSACRAAVRSGLERVLDEDRANRARRWVKRVMREIT